jgi:hypothetical protein
MQEDVDGSLFVPQSQTKLRLLKSSTRLCSPWQEMEQA